MSAAHHYGIDSGPNGSSMLFRLVPLIRRLRAALAVPLGGAIGDVIIGPTC
jgi:hypothetical protein